MAFFFFLYLYFFNILCILQCQSTYKNMPKSGILFPKSFGTMSFVGAVGRAACGMFHFFLFCLIRHISHATPFYSEPAGSMQEEETKKAEWGYR